MHTVTPSLATLADELETRLQEADEAVKSAKGRQPASLRGNSRSSQTGCSRPASPPHLSRQPSEQRRVCSATFPARRHSPAPVKDAAEVKELVRLAAEQLR
jgi:hypothetical protein